MTRPGRNRLRTGHRQARWPSQTPALLSQSSFNWGSSWPPTSGRNCGKRKVSRRFTSKYVCCEKDRRIQTVYVKQTIGTSVPQYRSTNTFCFFRFAICRRDLAGTRVSRTLRCAQSASFGSQPQARQGSRSKEAETDQDQSDPVQDEGRHRS